MHSFAAKALHLADGMIREVAMYRENDDPSDDWYADFSVNLFQDPDTPQLFCFRETDGDVEYLGGNLDMDFRKAVGAMPLPQREEDIKPKRKYDMER